MLTPFGIAIRKLRLEKQLRLLDIADRMGLSSAFVSAVETGKKPIPDDYIPSVVQAMRLNTEEARELGSAADRTRSVVRVDRLPPGQREFVAAFARSVDTLPADLAARLKRAVYKSMDMETPFKRRRRGLLVGPASAKDLREFSEIVRGAFVPPDQIEFPIMDVLEFRLGMYFEGFYIDPCSREEMGNEEGRVVAGENCIKLREDVYRGAWCGNGRDRFTASHELAHFLLHREIKLARMCTDEQPIFQDAEWQADTFAGSLLMSARHLPRLTGPAHAAAACGMTQAAAAVMLAKYGKDKSMQL